MPHFVRVEDRGTGDQYDVAAEAFDETLHKKVNAPKEWPDLTGDGDRPRPAVLSADLPRRTSTRPARQTRKRSTQARATDQAEQSATTTKER